MHCAALRTNRGDKFSLACGPERVVKRAQPWHLAEEFQVLEATDTSPFSRHQPGLKSALLYIAGGVCRHTAI